MADVSNPLLWLEPSEGRDLRVQTIQVVMAHGQRLQLGSIFPHHGNHVCLGFTLGVAVEHGVCIGLDMADHPIGGVCHLSHADHIILLLRRLRTDFRRNSVDVASS